MLRTNRRAQSNIVKKMSSMKQTLDTRELISSTKVQFVSHDLNHDDGKEDKGREEIRKGNVETSSWWCHKAFIKVQHFVVESVRHVESGNVNAIREICKEVNLKLQFGGQVKIIVPVSPIMKLRPS